MIFNEESLSKLLSTSSGEAAYRAYSKVLDFQRSLMLRRLRGDAPDLFEEAVAGLLELNRLSEAELLPPVVEGDLEAAGRDEVECAVLGHAAGTLDAVACGRHEPILYEERKAQTDALGKPKRGKAVVIGAAICLVIAAVAVVGRPTPSDEGMLLADVDIVLDAASSSEVEERFPSAEASEDGGLEIRGSCGGVEGVYTVNLENDAPSLVTFTPTAPDKDKLLKNAMEARFGAHDGYNSRLKYFEYNDSAASLLIKYYPDIGIYFYPN